jgi:hypothetical protein
LVGSFIGKTPFSKISPKKTWEGTIGGAFLCILIIALLGKFIPIAQKINVIHWISIATLCAVFGSIGDLIKDASRPGVDEKAKQQLDNSINLPKHTEKPTNKQPEADSSTNPIQKPISSNKAGWCLVGEYEGRRGCIQVGQEDKCLSGQVYPNQKMCLNPTLTQN